MAKRFWPVAGSTRNLAQYFWKASATEDEGVIGYQAATVAPPYTQPSAAALLPSTKIRSPTRSARRTRMPSGASQVLAREVAAQVQRLHVGGQQLFLALVLLAEQLLDHLRLDAQQDRQRADVDDVLEQLALARVVVDGVADLGQRHADDADVVAELRRAAAAACCRRTGSRRAPARPRRRPRSAGSSRPSCRCRRAGPR